jgi:predicted AAA+ superfamily ATPase
MHFLNRYIEDELLQLVDDRPVVAILGPRQVGKTTLVKNIISKLSKQSVYLDLELPSDLLKLSNAELYLKDFDDKTIIIDEVQRMPELFPLIRALVDQNRIPSRFVLLGSASPELLLKSGETLAGRVAYAELHPLNIFEARESVSQKQHWLRGGFPDMLLASSDAKSFKRTGDFINSYIEREFALLGLPTSPNQLRKLLFMIAGVQGQLLNMSSFAKSLDLSITSISRILDYFENAYLIRRLQPWFTNNKKRLVKSPKIFIRDSGLLHFLLGINDFQSLQNTVHIGYSWESYVIQNIISILPYDCHPFFYRTSDGSEMDLIIVKGDKPVLCTEVKYSLSPKLTKGNNIAHQDLGSVPLYVVVPEGETYRLEENKTVISLVEIMKIICKL